MGELVEVLLTIGGGGLVVVHVVTRRLSGSGDRWRSSWDARVTLDVFKCPNAGLATPHILYCHSQSSGDAWNLTSCFETRIAKAIKKYMKARPEISAHLSSCEMPIDRPILPTISKMQPPM